MRRIQIPIIYPVVVSVKWVNQNTMQSDLENWFSKHSDIYWDIFGSTDRQTIQTKQKLQKNVIINNFVIFSKKSIYDWNECKNGLEIKMKSRERQERDRRGKE